MSTAKHQLRRTLAHRRDAIDPQVRRALSAAICRRVLGHPAIVASRRIALYASQGSEVQTHGLFDGLQARGVRCFYPQVRGPHLTFAAIAQLSDLQPGAFGIAEPPGPPVGIENFDVVVVPGLGFDARGNRLGYGKGYYDRALTAYRGCTMGLAFAVQMVDAIAVSSEDQPMHYVMTELAVIHAAAPSQELSW